MELDRLTKGQIENGSFPLRELLFNSVYYPACGQDGRPIQYCNETRRDLGVNSFVYCDFLVGEEAFLEDTKSMSGYRVLAHRHIKPEEYIPEGWELEMVHEEPQNGVIRPDCYRDTFPEHKGCRMFAHWVVFERNYLSSSSQSSTTSISLSSP